MANSFVAGGQLTMTTDIENFPGFLDGVRGPEMMDTFHAQLIHFCTKIITEIISKINLSVRPFRYWREGQEEGEPETRFQRQSTHMWRTARGYARARRSGMISIGQPSMCVLYTHTKGNTTHGTPNHLQTPHPCSHITHPYAATQSNHSTGMS